MPAVKTVAGPICAAGSGRPRVRNMSASRRRSKSWLKSDALAAASAVPAQVHARRAQSIGPTSASAYPTAVVTSTSAFKRTLVSSAQMPSVPRARGVGAARTSAPSDALAMPASVTLSAPCCAAETCAALARASVVRPPSSTPSARRFACAARAEISAESELIGRG